MRPVSPRRLSTRARIAYMAAAIINIQRRQEHCPGFNQDIIDSIVRSELRQLEREQERFDKQEARR